MTDFFFRERTLDDLIEAYIASRGKRRYICVSTAIRAIRILSKTDISDRELADLIAAVAVRRSIAVEFDGNTSARKFTAFAKATSGVEA